jgi:hypothetical protein
VEVADRSRLVGVGRPARKFVSQMFPKVTVEDEGCERDEDEHSHSRVPTEGTEIVEDMAVATAGRESMIVPVVVRRECRLAAAEAPDRSLAAGSGMDSPAGLEEAEVVWNSRPAAVRSQAPVSHSRPAAGHTEVAVVVDRVAVVAVHRIHLPAEAPKGKVPRRRQPPSWKPTAC